MPRPTTLHLELLGSVFRLESPEGEVADELRRLWRPLLSEPRHVVEHSRFRVTTTGRCWTAWRGSTVLGSSRDSISLLAVLATHLNSAAITECHELVLHAGAVARDGGVTALAAVSGGGKTTLTAACVSNGWDYVTDEALCLRRDGAVVPYAKPLTMSAASRALLGLHRLRADDDGERLVAVEDLHGSLPRPDRLHLSEVVLLDRSEHDAPARCELVPLHSSDVLTGLLPLSFNHYKHPARSVQVLARAALASRAWVLRYTDARAAAALLSDVLPRGTGQDPPLDPLSRGVTPT